MHRPEKWGFLQFTRKSPDSSPALTPLPGKAARNLALEVYYAQRDYRRSHNNWAKDLEQLGFKSSELPPGVEQPVLEQTADGYTCSVAFKEGENRRAWRIRQDRLLTLE
jgi:hypothetical protein